MHTVPIVVVALLAAATCGCATQRAGVAAQSAPADATTLDPAWAALDSNHSGFLTVDELHAQRATALLQDFTHADTDHDGRISWSEWNAWWPRITHTPPSPSMASLNATDTERPPAPSK